MKNGAPNKSLKPTPWRQAGTVAGFIYRGFLQGWIGGAA